MKKYSETAMKYVFMASATVSIIAVVVICLFLFSKGFPTIAEIGVFEFLGGTTWKPLEGHFGIFPMIVGSIYVTAGAIILGVPIGILCAVFMARFCPKRLYKILKPAVDLLAGIPSIVYGFFALMVIVPAMQNIFGGSGKGILTASILLAIMILPTIIGVAESALRAVPESYYEGALALGATHERSVFYAVLLGIMILPTIITVSKTSLDAVPQSYYEGSLALGATHERSVFCVVLPAAKSGVMSAVILGVGRAIGETMAVIMVAGNQPRMPKGILQGVRTLTGNIVIEMGYAADLHREALIATGVVLFVFILLINLCFSLVKGGEKNG